MQVFIGMVSLFFTSLSMAHAYYFSTSEISLDQNSQRFEWVVEMSSHDLEYVLTDVFDQKINLDKDSDRLLLKTYLLQHLSMQADHKPVQLVWVGAETGHNKTIVYVESESTYTTPPNGLLISNTLFVDVFKSQINIVNYSIGKNKDTLTFNQNTRSLTAMRAAE